MDVNDFPVDYIEESHSDVLSEINIDLLLADVSEVQKILNSNNVGQHVDVNEIYEKLEELTYIVREERIGYVATQLLYKFGIITDKDGDGNFKFNIHHGANDVGNLSLPHGLSVPDISEACISSDEDAIVAEVLQNSILVQSGRSEQHSDVCEVFNTHKTYPNYDREYYSEGSDINHSFHVEEATKDKIFVDRHSTNCAQENMTELKPSVCNEGLGNFVLVAEARNSDNPVFSQNWGIMQEATDNPVFSQNQKIMQEAEARNTDNPVLSEDQELMQEAEFISGMFPHFELEQIVEFININKDIENRVETVSEEILKLQESMLEENREMSEVVSVKDKANSKDLHEHSNEQDNNVINYAAKEVTHIKSEKEQLLQDCDSVNYLPNNDSVTGQTSAPEFQFPQQKNSVFQSNQGYSTMDKQKPIYAADENLSHFEPVVFVPETNASTPSPVRFVLPEFLRFSEKNSISQSNLEPVNILDQDIPVLHKLSDFVPSVPSIVNEVTQRNTDIHCSVTELVPTISQLNKVVTPDIIDSSASEPARTKPETLQSVSQPNSLNHENVQSSADILDLSYSAIGSQAKVVSTITKSNDAEDKVTESTDEVNVLCEIYNSASEQESSQTNEVIELTDDEVNEVNVLCEIYNSASEQESSQTNEVTELTDDEVNVLCELYTSASEQESSQSEASTLPDHSECENNISPQLTSSDFKSAASVHHDDVSPVFERAETSAYSLNNPPTEVVQPMQLTLNQGCRKKEITYEEFVAALPNVDIVLLKDVWAQIGNNYSAIREFISQQLEDESDDNPYHLLLSMFPQTDPKFLQENSLIIGSDEAALKQFIDEQLKLSDSKAQYHMLLSMFPKVDSTFLHDKCIQIGNDEEAMRKLIVELLNSSEPEDNNYHTLLAMFPDSDPAFLYQEAERIANDDDAMKKFVAEHLEEVEAVQFRTLLAVLPDADPEYLHKTYQELGNNEESIKLFITEALENKDYPTRESYLKRKEIATLKRKYKEELNLEEYLDVIPDPWNYFRKGKTSTKDERQHVLSYLELRYKSIAMAQIESTLQDSNYNLTLTCEKLDKWIGPFCENRVIFEHLVSETEDIPISFLQEVSLTNLYKSIFVGEISSLLKNSFNEY